MDGGDGGLGGDGGMAGGAADAGFGGDFGGFSGMGDGAIGSGLDGGGFGGWGDSMSLSDAFGNMDAAYGPEGAFSGDTNAANAAIGNFNDTAFGLPAQDDSFLGKLSEAYQSFMSTPYGKATALGLSIAQPQTAPVFGLLNTVTQAQQGKGASASLGAFGNAVSNFGIGPTATMGLNAAGIGLGPSMAAAGQGLNGIGVNAPANTADGYGGFTQGLLGLGSALAQYQNYRKMNGAADQLSQMFSPGSAYARQLKQEMSRKDAAAGRRTQYGPRLQNYYAQLALQKANSMPALLNMYQNAGNAQAALWRELGQGFTNGTYNGLAGIFGG